jgi:3',5'-cyclic AMP phosphodiesterase CpdA
MFTDNKDFAQETANFEFAVASVNRLHPAFIVITGDLVNKSGDAAQIAEFQRIAAKVDPSIPVYNVVGNHDIENVPSPARIAAFTNQFGPDHYVFRRGSFVGIVLNSIVIHSPQNTTNEFAEQERWLKAELKSARDDDAQHIVVFQHHPWFLKAAEEPDQYFNIPRERRAPYLALFHEFGVKYLFSGHYHRNGIGHDAEIEAVTTGPVGKPMGEDKSGFRIVIVRENRLEHRYYTLGELPTRVDLAPSKTAKPNPPPSSAQ